MQDFLKQDIFFFVTTVAVIVFTVLLSVLVFYLIRISRKVDYITDKAKRQVDLISEELDEVRKSVKNAGVKFKSLLSFFGSWRKK